MKKILMLQELKAEIEEKRNKLNSLIINNVDKNELLQSSIELDKLIGEYYKKELDISSH